MKIKMNGWPDHSSIWPARLACLPLPKGAKYTAIVNIANLLEYLEEATLYTHLWAGFARGITVPETFICIFNVLRCQIVHDYYLHMALGYIVYQCVVAATAHHFNWDTLNGLLITLAVFRCQVPNFPQIWEEILTLQRCGEQLDASLQLCTPSLLLSPSLWPNICATRHADGPLGNSHLVE
jgi:hypothetical protein